MLVNCSPVRIFLGTRSTHQWNRQADRQLLSMVNEYGPTWTLLSFKFPRRSPIQVRRRYLQLTNAFCHARTKNPLPPAVLSRLRAGWDRTDAGDWIYIPMDKIDPSPYAQLAERVPRYRWAFQKRQNNWADEEEWHAVLFGALEYQGDWEKVVSKLKRRTSVQAKNYFEGKLSFLIRAPDEKIDQIRQQLFAKYLPKKVIMHQCVDK